MKANRRGVLVGISMGGAALATGRFSGAPLNGHADDCLKLARALADAMSAKHGGKWRHTVDHESRFVLIAPEP